MKNDPHYIYALGDPRTGDIHWIGITLNPYQRWHQHCGIPKHRSSQYTRWMTDLDSCGLRPAFIVLETIFDDFARIERDWIMRLLDEGRALYNVQKRTDDTEFARDGVSGGRHVSANACVQHRVMNCAWCRATGGDGYVAVRSPNI